MKAATATSGPRVGPWEAGSRRSIRGGGSVEESPPGSGPAIRHALFLQGHNACSGRDDTGTAGHALKILDRLGADCAEAPGVRCDKKVQVSQSQTLAEKLEVMGLQVTGYFRQGQGIVSIGYVFREGPLGQGVQAGHTTTRRFWRHLRLVHLLQA